MTEMKCGRGHTLKAPWFYFPDVLWVGITSPEYDAMAEKYGNWAALMPDGSAKEDGYRFCPECFMELLMVMERWRTGDEELHELIKTWKVGA